jgi:hypothetical protein
LKKWLSYRDKKVLGRGLSLDEIGEVRDIARRVAAILLMEPSLDANYQAVKSSTHKWTSPENAATGQSRA